MKKVLILVAATGLSAAAFAQSNVTIYGSLDQGVAYINNLGGKAVTRIDSGTLQPDRIGFRGSEELGGGMKANFQLESGFFPDTGSQVVPGKLFNRIATVGLSGDFGSVSFGHMPDLVYDYANKFSNGVMLLNFYLFHPGNLDNLANQLQFDNTIRYSTPIFSGLQWSGMYGFGEVAGNSQKSRNFSTGANYANGPFRAALAYTKNNDRPSGAGTPFLASLGFAVPTTLNSVKTLAVGAGYDFGNVRLNGLYTQIKIEGLGRSGTTQKNADLGVRYRYTSANAFNLGYTHSKFERALWNQLGLSNIYSLSKRTEVYAQIAYQRAGGDAKFAVINGVGVSGNISQTVTSVGVHHSF